MGNRLVLGLDVVSERLVVPELSYVVVYLLFVNAVNNSICPVHREPVPYEDVDRLVLWSAHVVLYIGPISEATRLNPLQ